MRFNTRIEGSAFHLRPVEMADAEFIFSLRSDPRLTRFLQDGARTLEDQRQWQLSQAERPDDYYFIVERAWDGRPEGTVALYKTRGVDESAEWGRWILRPGSLAAVETVCLIYTFGLETLDLPYQFSRTNMENARTVSLHDASGIPRRGSTTATITIRGESRLVTAIEHGCLREQWPECRETLRPLVEKAARFVERGVPRMKA